MCFNNIYGMHDIKYRQKIIFLPICVMMFKRDDVTQWYEHIKNVLKCGEIYSHKELTDELKILKPDLADSTYHWAISSLVRGGQIIRLGYNAYASPDSSTKKEYYPLYSAQALEVTNQIKEKYSYVIFTVLKRL